MRLEQFCPNLFVSNEDRDIFLKRISARYTNKETGQKYPNTDAVIFTGTMDNANMMRNRFDKRTLFIANGAGHNPIVITESADVDAAAHSTLRVQFYNQGQDCANPNTLLVHSSLKDAYIEKLMHGICNMKIGPYKDRSNKIGPITDSKELERIQQFLIANQKWIHPDTPGVIEVGRNIVQPTIIIKPLKEGGNYTEQFAPIMYVQEYEDDAQLSSYFDTPDYHTNAMYVTVFGKSEYIDGLLNQRQTDGTPIHDRNTIIYNNDLHAPGVERGTQPYGGYGRGASCYGINGKIVCGPTLPQRDMYTQLVKPALHFEANNIKIPALV